MPSPSEPYFHPLAARAMQDRIAARMFGEHATPIKIGRFVVESMLGSGGTGIVFRCHDPELDRPVAVKILNRDRVADDEVELLRAEARALAKLEHPNVVTVHEIGEHEGSPFVVMECIAGLPLDRWQTTAPRPLRERLHACRQVAAGVAAAHEIGIVHRDLKPANVMMANNGRLRVVDFGLARSRAASTPGHATDTDAGTTSVGGTAQYAAPEQLAGQPPDASSDQFSLCMVLWETVFGVRAFDLDQLRRAARGEAPLPRPQPGPWGGPGWLRRVLTRGLAGSREERWPTVAALLQELERGSHPRSPWALGLAIAAASTGVAYAAVRDSPCALSEAALADTWGRSRRAAVVALADRPELAFAGTALATLADELDEHAAAWLEVANESCRAARVDGRASMEWLAAVDACLEQQKHQVDAIVDRLLLGDAGTLASTDAMLASLRAPDECVVSSETAPATGGDPDAEEARFDGELALAAGALEDADARLGRALELAVAAGDARSHAHALASRAAHRRMTGRFDDAERDLLASVKLAEGTRSDDLAASGWCALVELAAIDLKRPDLARQWLDRSEAAMTRLGAPHDARACHELARGHADWVAGDAVMAVAAYRRALDMRQADPRSTPRELALATRALGNALADAGEPSEAILLYEELRSRQVARLGEGHPDVADIDFDLAFALALVGRADEAGARAERARASYERIFGLGSDRHAAALVRRADIELQRGAVEEAIALAERAIALYRDHTEPAALAALANALVAAGRLQPALEVHLRLAAALPQAAERSRVSVEIDIGELQCLLAACESAAPHYEWALAHVRPDDPLRLFAANGLGKVALARGESKSAAARLRHVLDDATPGDPALAELRAEAQWQLARALLAGAGEPREALALIARAREYYATTPRDDVRTDLDRLAAQAETTLAPHASPH